MNMRHPLAVAFLGLALATANAAEPAAASTLASGGGASLREPAESPRGKANRVRVVPTKTPDRLDRTVAAESPRGRANRVKIVSGITPDRLDRGLPAESPKALANRVVIVPGKTVDTLGRRPDHISPRAANNFPWLATNR